MGVIAYWQCLVWVVLFGFWVVWVWVCLGLGCLGLYISYTDLNDLGCLGLVLFGFGSVWVWVRWVF